MNDHPNPDGEPPRQPDPAPRPRSTTKRRVIVALTVPVILSGLAATDVTPSSAQTDPPLEADVLDYRTLDGSENNPDDAALGQAGTIYPRVAAANYADGIGEAIEGPDERYLSNRIFNAGWVRNTAAGSVELEVQGNPSAVEALLRWAETGPVGARVDRVAVVPRPLEEQEADFRVLH